jgi:hypothetical protein
MTKHPWYLLIELLFMSEKKPGTSLIHSAHAHSERAIQVSSAVKQNGEWRRRQFLKVMHLHPGLP